MIVIIVLVLTELSPNSSANGNDKTSFNHLIDSVQQQVGEGLDATSPVKPYRKNKLQCTRNPTWLICTFDSYHNKHSSRLVVVHLSLNWLGGHRVDDEGRLAVDLVLDMLRKHL